MNQIETACILETCGQWGSGISVEIEALLSKKKGSMYSLGIGAEDSVESGALGLVLGLMQVWVESWEVGLVWGLMQDCRKWGCENSLGIGKGWCRK